MTPMTAAHSSAKLLAREMAAPVGDEEGAVSELVSVVSVVSLLVDEAEVDALVEVLDRDGRLRVELRPMLEAPVPLAPVPTAPVGRAVVLPVVVTLAAEGAMLVVELTAALELVDAATDERLDEDDADADEELEETDPSEMVNWPVKLLSSAVFLLATLRVI